MKEIACKALPGEIEREKTYGLLCDTLFFIGLDLNEVMTYDMI